MPGQYIKQKTPEFWKATLALSLGGFAVMAIFYMTQPLLPMFSEKFGVAPATASLTVSLVTFTLSISLLFFGPVSDALGRKSVIAFGLLAPSLISLGTFFVHSFHLLLLFRALQGTTLAALPAITFAYIGEEYESSAIGAAMGIYISSNSIGGMGGRVISGFVADTWGWEFSFLTMGILGMCCFLLLVFWLPESQHFVKHKLSFHRAVQETKSHWQNKILRDAYYIAGIIFFVFMGLFNYLNYHLHQAPYGLSTTFIGLLYLAYLAGTFSSSLSGKLDHVLSTPRRVLLGLALMIAGTLLMITPPLLLILTGLVILCFGFFFTHSASSSWVSNRAQYARGSASALYLLSYYMGASLGSTLLGYIWEPWGWIPVCLTCIALIVLAMAVTLRMEKRNQDCSKNSLFS